MRLHPLPLLALLVACSADPSAPEPLARRAHALAQGDLVINEIYYNAKGSTESGKEWFELYNPTSAPIDLAGLVFREGGGPHPIQPPTGSPAIVPAKGFLLLGQSSDPTANGGVNVAYAYGKSISLGNSGELLSIETAEGLVIDQVTYSSSAPFPPSTDGTAIGLDPTSPSAQANDSGAAWCLATSTFGTEGARATPRQPNDPCGGGQGGAGGQAGAGGSGQGGAPAGGQAGKGGAPAGGQAGQGGAVVPGPCCQSGPGAGCDDPKVEACVCAEDSYCCETRWDTTCAKEVLEFSCGQCAGGAGGAGGKAGAGGGAGQAGAGVSGAGGAPAGGQAGAAQGGAGAAGSGTSGQGGTAGGAPSTGSCCESHDTPGCVDAAVQACVCAQDEICCDEAWDHFCVSEVDDFGCGTCATGQAGAGGAGGGAQAGQGGSGVPAGSGGQGGVVGANACCVESPQPGCNDAAVQACVCAKDPLCCAATWDKLCVQEVVQHGCATCGGGAGGTSGGSGQGTSGQGGATGKAGGGGTVGGKGGSSAGGQAAAGGSGPGGGGLGVSGKGPGDAPPDAARASGATDDGGCGCRAAGEPSRGGAWGALLAGALLAGRRRRR